MFIGPARPAVLAGAFCFLISALPSQILAQTAPPDQTATLPELVVTAYRSEQSLARAGSAITVVTAAEIEKNGSKSIADVLRSVPGLDITEQGGIGGITNASLRGSNPGQTLVLIDGIRVGDPSSTDVSFDFGGFSVTDIERIEVLRGPQSALYGSDAMGGIINIITRKGKRAPRTTYRIEGGSYGTLSSRLATSGGTDRLTYAFSIDGLHDDGFARFGYRNPRLPGTWPLVPKHDPTNKLGGSARISYRLGDDIEAEAGFTSQWSALRFDNPYAFDPANIYSPYNQQKAFTNEAYGKITADTFGGILRNSVTIFAARTERYISETESCPDYVSNCRTNFQGNRVGTEYQGNLQLGAYGLLIFGLRSEQENMNSSVDWAPPAIEHDPGVKAGQTTNSIFALHQITLFERLHLSLGGRLDDVSDSRTFATWRATAAYNIDETGTKLRASAGTGAKAPSLYQRFSIYGTPDLHPEENIGFDAGIDQSFLNERVKFSATGFYSHYRNLIDFSFGGCGPLQFMGCYYNVGRAETKGMEFSTEAVLIPDVLRTRASYTYMIARNLTANQDLLRRPQNKGVFSLIWTGIPNLELEGRITLVGRRWDFDYNFAYTRVQMPAYGKFDLLANYRINDTFSVYARAENLTNARYEEVYNYSVPGRSFFAGLKATW